MESGFEQVHAIGLGEKKKEREGKGKKQGKKRKSTRR